MAERTGVSGLKKMYSALARREIADELFEGGLRDLQTRFERLSEMPVSENNLEGRDRQDWAEVKQPDWFGSDNPMNDFKMLMEQASPLSDEPGLDDPIGQALYAHQYRRTYAASIKEDEAARALEAVKAMSPGQLAELRGLLLGGARSHFLWLPCEGGFVPPLSEGPQRRDR